MSNPTRGAASPPGRDSASGRTLRRDPRSHVEDADEQLSRLLESPQLRQLTPHLAPEIVQQIIRVRGLDACDSLIASATPAQLTAVLDLDLWKRARPSSDEEFDEIRFGEWLEMLAEADPSVAARILAALNSDVLVTGLARSVRVFDPGVFEPTESSDDEPSNLMAPPEDALVCEVGGYHVRSRTTERWDAIVTLLLALDAEQPEVFHAVMQGVRRLSNAGREHDGLDDLLDAPEQLQHDISLAREGRRTEVGYVTPADARALLEMVRRSTPGHGTAATNPIARAYFRASAEAHAEARHAGAGTRQETGHVPVSDAGQPVSGPISADSDSTTLDFVQAVAQLLDEINLKPSRSRGLLTGATTSPSEARLIEQLLASAQDRSEDAYSARVRELAFLANTLMSGCSVQGRAFTREEASDAAAGICNIGLEQLAPSSENFLVEHDLVSVFETGWRVLHQDVSLFIGRELLAVLRHLRCSDAEIQSGLHRLEHALTGQIAAGTPWRAREHLEVLAMLDVPVWISVSGLLDECPVMPAAMTAILDRRSGAVSASAFEFVGTMGQVQRIQDFAGRLDSLLR